MKLRKIGLMSILAIGCGLITMPSISADEIANGTSGSTVVTKTIASSYTVSIPKSVDMTSTTADVSIKVKGNLAPKKALNVTVSPTINMSRADDTTYKGNLQVTLSTTSFVETDLTSVYKDVMGTATFTETKAGTYSGTINFNIALVQK